jgi:hypothetical protein
MDADSAFVLRFAQALYSVGYQNCGTQETTLLGWVAKDYSGDFKSHYFNSEIIKKIKDINRVRTFTPSAPVKWVSSNETAGEFLVLGTMVSQGGLAGQMPWTSNKAVKARIQVIHDAAGKPLVRKIDETISE